MAEIESSIIDVHAHAIPAGVVESLEQGSFASIELSWHGERRVFAFPNMAPSPPAPESLFEVGLRAEWSSSQGIDVQLVGPWTDLLGYTLPADEAGNWSRLYNESLVVACANRDGMMPMATVPLQFPDVAVRELEAAREMGCRGLVIGTDVPGITLGSPNLDDLWATAGALSMPVLVHPTFLDVPRRLGSRGLKNAVGRAGETTVALAHLVYSGVLVRYPDLVVVAAHGGGAFVPLVERILRNYELEWAETSADPKASVERLYFDSVVLDPVFLRYLIGQVGSDRIMLGSDYPFPWEPHPVRMVRDAGLTSEETADVLTGTAAGVFGL